MRVHIEIIVSPAGAIGYIQVMPLTGAKLADILEREDYSPKDLEDPQINYNMERITSLCLCDDLDMLSPCSSFYNGGPRNVSRWLKNLKDIRDQFVEHIAFDESRIYAKKYQHTTPTVESYEGHTIKFLGRLQTDASIVDFKFFDSISVSPYEQWSV